MTTEPTSKDERVIVEQSSTSVVVLSSEQIVATVEQLHVCYDYCAGWKEPTLDDDQAVRTMHVAEQEEHPADLIEAKR